MIIAERNYCIYCRGELLDEKEIIDEYHTSCRNEFQLERTELDIFNQPDVLNFKKQTFLKMIYKAILGGILLIIYMTFVLTYEFISFYFFLLAFMLGFCFAGYIFVELSKLYYVRNFCDLIIKLKPQYQFLSRKICLSILGDIYIVHKPTTFNCDYFYLVKFFDSSFIENNRIKLPSPKFTTEFNKEEHSIKLARFREIYQIPYNSLQSRKGESIVYCIQFSEVRKRYEDVSYLIFQMNRETPIFTPYFKEHSKIKLFLSFIGPLILFGLIREMIIFLLS